MPDFVYFNDKIVPAADAKVSVFDHGFLYGDGLFETMRACGTRIHLVDQHLERLFCSAQVMKLVLPWSKEEMKAALAALLKANELEEAAVRLTISRGEGLPIPDPAVCEKPTMVITCRAAAALKGDTYEKGVEVTLLSTRRNLSEAFPTAIKSCNFLNNIFARMELKEGDAFEGLMLNHKGFLTEGTVSNLFFAKEGVLLTPSLECGLLAGVTRAEVIRLAKSLNVKVVEGSFTVEALQSAEEAFLTNSVSLVVPVRKVESVEMTASPGPLTSKISTALSGSLLFNT